MAEPQGLASEDAFLLAVSRTDQNETVADCVRRLADVPLNWHRVCRDAQRHQIGPLCHFHIAQMDPFLRFSIPSWVRTRFREEYETSKVDVGLMEDELQRISTALREASVTFLVLKGLALGTTVYVDPVLRPFYDLDLAVLPDDLGRAGEALCGLGYAQLVRDIGGGSESDAPAPAAINHYYTRFIHHGYPFKRDVFMDPPSTGTVPRVRLQRGARSRPFKRSIEIELHHSLFAALSNFEVEMPEIFGRAVSDTSISGLEFRTLSPEDCLIYLSEHLSRHVTHFPMCASQKLLAWCDIREALRHFRCTLDWKLVQERTRNMRVQTPVYSTLHHVCELYDETLPAEAIHEISRVEVEFLNEFSYEGYHSRRYRWRTEVGKRLFLGDCEPEALQIVKETRRPNRTLDCDITPVPPDIDARLRKSEWKSAGTLTISPEHANEKGPFAHRGKLPARNSCLSARGTVCWDATCVYVEVAVTTKRVITAAQRPLGLYWDQDAILLEFDVGRDNVDYKRFALLPKEDVDSGAVCIDLVSKGKQRLLDGVAVAGRIEEGRYCVEVALPNTELGISPRPGLSVGFDVWLVNCEHEHAGATSLLSWAGGLRNWGGGELRFRG